ncbi:MAG: hypothetical protein N2235_02450 [Fischerella sp.]|nr:hypothetical protein [Fischerella sp.]
MTTKIIAFVGLIGSGKDTCAQYLVEHHGFCKESFASSLKDAVAAVFGWDRKLLEGATEESRVWREQVDIWWSNRLNMPQLTPRWILQNWGTDLCRKNFHDDIWIASLENRIRNSVREKVVISDCRFENELNVIKKYNGKIIRVKRGEDPDWWPFAVAAMQGDAAAKIAMSASGIHITEWGWAGLDFDEIIENNGTLEDLYLKVKNLV